MVSQPPSIAGSFSNVDDTETGLREILAASFGHVELETVGSMAISRRQPRVQEAQSTGSPICGTTFSGRPDSTRRRQGRAQSMAADPRAGDHRTIWAWLASVEHSADGGIDPRLEVRVVERKDLGCRELCRAVTGIEDETADIVQDEALAVPP